MRLSGAFSISGSYSDSTAQTRADIRKENSQPQNEKSVNVWLEDENHLKMLVSMHVSFEEAEQIDSHPIEILGKTDHEKTSKMSKGKINVPHIITNLGVVGEVK